MDLLFIETNSNSAKKLILESIQIQKKNVEVSQKIKNAIQLIQLLSNSTKTFYVQASLKNKR
jgi:hypothetical protein